MFALYRNGSRPGTWVFSTEVSIAGILARAMEGRAEVVKPKNHEGMPWALTGTGFCAAVREIFKPDDDAAGRRYKLIIDATWGRGDALLLEVINVWGYAYCDWTPLMLQLRDIAEENRPNGPSTPIPQFSCEEVVSGRRRTCDYVHEFLYLQCGYDKDIERRRRNWGRMGYTNAALLYPDAFRHLLAQVGFVPATIKE